MIFDGKLVVQVEPGTVIVDAASGKRYRVNENQAVVQSNVLYVTPERYLMLKELVATAEVPSGGDSSS
jgi:hypothetical protein